MMYQRAVRSVPVCPGSMPERLQEAYTSVDTLVSVNGLARLEPAVER